MPDIGRRKEKPRGGMNAAPYCAEKDPEEDNKKYVRRRGRTLGGHPIRGESERLGERGTRRERDANPNANEMSTMGT
jgi:hypothetical protein